MSVQVQVGYGLVLQEKQAKAVSPMSDAPGRQTEGIPLDLNLSDIHSRNDDANLLTIRAEDAQEVTQEQSGRGIGTTYRRASVAHNNCIGQGVQ